VAPTTSLSWASDLVAELQACDDEVPPGAYSVVDLCKGVNISLHTLRNRLLRMANAGKLVKLNLRTSVDNRSRIMNYFMEPAAYRKWQAGLKK
jgi:hypothetical protein